MQENATKSKGDLIYGLEDNPPFRDRVFAALQHLLTMFVAVVTPPLIIAAALGFDAETTGYLVSMALVVSGVSTYVQCRRFGCVGSGLFCIQGTSYSFIAPIIAAGQLGGLPLIIGSCMAASTVEMLVSVLLRYLRKVIPPLVSGITTGSVVAILANLFIRIKGEE